MVTRKLALEGSFPLLDRGFLYWVLRGCWRISVFRQGVCVCVCMCVSVCECECSRRASKLGLNVYSGIFCLCLCARMCHRRSLISAFEMEGKGLSKCHVEFCQCELQMRVRQVGFDQGSCDVVGAMCVCACVCFCACLCLCVRMYHGCFSMSIFEMESKERFNFHVQLCQCELQMQVRQL